MGKHTWLIASNDDTRVRLDGVDFGRSMSYNVKINELMRLYRNVELLSKIDRVKLSSLFSLVEAVSHIMRDDGSDITASELLEEVSMDDSEECVDIVDQLPESCADTGSVTVSDVDGPVCKEESVDGVHGRVSEESLFKGDKA